MNSLHYKSRTLRHPIYLEANIKRSDGASQTTAVENFSLNGCCVQGYFKIGEEITIQLPRLGTFKAKVRWAVLGKAGVRFEGRPPV